MSRSTEKQLKKLETIFGLKRVEHILPVRDGVVFKDMTVWWRCNVGPEQVLASTHWANIQMFPNTYQLEKPTVARVIYSD